MIRKAFQQVQKKQKRTYQIIVAVVALAALAAGGYAYYGQRAEWRGSRRSRSICSTP